MQKEYYYYYKMFMMTFLELIRFFHPEIPGLGNAQSQNFGIEKVTGIRDAGVAIPIRRVHKHTHFLKP